MSTFEPVSILALLKNLERPSQQKSFEDDWKAKVRQRVEGWKRYRSVQSDCPEQLEWAANVVQYVNYIHKATTVRGGPKNGEAPPILRIEVPILGPRFLPPSYIHIQKRSPTPAITPTSAYLKPLHIIHPFYNPELAKCPQCDSKNILWEGWNTAGYREVHGAHREETALGYQLKCQPCRDSPQQSNYCFATTNAKFWENKEHWEIPRGIPHFFSHCAVTRDLHDMIVELCPSTTSGGIAENIKQLHLLEYNRTKLEYLQYFESRKKHISLIPVTLKAFSEPWDSHGYRDKSITDDLITDVYTAFSDQTRSSESQAYLRTLTAKCLSLDNTFKVSSKATVVDKDGKHSKLTKGGILNMLNEVNETVAWRFCQSCSPAEAQEVLEGIKRRCAELAIPFPEMMVVDNCCQVCSHLTKVMPDMRIVLDVYHFLMRYLTVVMNGTRNPHRSAVARDITNAILKTRAVGGVGATYWSQEEQETRLVAAYNKWQKKGGVWTTAASETHLNQLAHVQKGCLARLRQDIRSDGSRIEGSHKGWNSLQRSFASGVELITALAHDFVLRRNCRIAAASQHPRAFTLSSHGSHHVHLVSAAARLWNALLAKEKGKATGKNKLEELPELQDVRSGEEFGLVASSYTTSFKGLLEIKEEYREEDEFGLSSFKESSPMDGLDINPTHGSANNTLPNHLQVSRHTVAILPSPSSSGIVDNTTAEIAELNTTSVQHKRKSIHLDELCPSNDEITIVKKPRVHDGQRLTPDHSTMNSTASNQPALPTTASASTDVFQLPVGPEFKKLTRSQRLFSLATRTDVRSLEISGDCEFYLFMAMRAERQWASFRMTPQKWVTETMEYNSRLQKEDPTAIAKNPRALLDKLIAMEVKIIDRVATNNYKSKRNSETFWMAACSAVSLVKTMKKIPTNDGKPPSRKPATCKRCRTIMYPGPTGAPENHKKGYCSDGVKQMLAHSKQNQDPPKPNQSVSLAAPVWPQPLGIFTNGTQFHPMVFLDKVRDMYAKVVIERASGELLLEHEAFAHLLARRTVVLENRSVLFKIFELECSASTPEGLIVTHESDKYLRVDCLREPLGS